MLALHSRGLSFFFFHAAYFTGVIVHGVTHGVIQGRFERIKSEPKETPKDNKRAILCPSKNGNFESRET